MSNAITKIALTIKIISLDMVKDEATAEKDIYEFLGHITSPVLISGSDDEPFRPCIVLADGLRATIPEDFSDQQLDMLKELAQNEIIRDPELQARIADIIWVRKKDYKMGQLAVKSYLESAQHLEDPEQWVVSFQRIQRATCIAASLGKNQPILRSVISYVEILLDKYQIDNYFPADLMRLLQKHRLGDFEKYTKLAEKLAISAENFGHWERAREYWNVADSWHKLSKDKTSKQRILIKIAETYVSESISDVSISPPDYIGVCVSLQKAIEAYKKIKGYREIEGMEEKIEELHKLLLKYQPQSMSEMKMISHEIDIGEMVEITIAKIQGKSFNDAIFELALMGSSPSVQKLQSQVEGTIRDFPLPFLMPERLHNQSGKLVANKPSINSNQPSESEKALQIHMLKNAQYLRQLHASIVVDPARYQINLEHNVLIKDFEFIVMNNPFIPPGREIIYAQGLLAGLKGDFLVSSHLIIPQIEHSIRYLMEQNGCLVSGLDNKGIQNEDNINTLIYRCELSEILGEDIVFDLRGLLVERFGSNLRNRMAHGLMNYNEFSTDDNSYLWWLILRLCSLPIISRLSKTKI